MKAWNEGIPVEIRSPKATRPWQHVLEPLSGYLNLGKDLNDNFSLNGEAFNFGPNTEEDYTVEELLKELSKYWSFKNLNDAYKVINNSPFHEAKLLKLNCEKAFSFLAWTANLDYKDTIKFTSEWYYDFYKTKNNMLDKTLDQINRYENLAKRQSLKWTE